VEAYLLDTSALTPLVDTGHTKHQAATTLITGLGAAPIYVSAIALAEMQYGFRLYEKSTSTLLPSAKQMMTAAQNFPRLDILHHTAAAYAELKATLATHYLPKVTKEFRKKYVEDWIDQFTGKALMVDDNDLWICAQALEMNFVVVAGDKMERIRAAEPKLKFLQIP
jgi:predicted nucleic acid-binding protein